MPTSASVTGAVAGIALVAAGVAVTGAPWQARQYRSVPVPPATASERTVVLAYLDALDAHDCGTASSLSTPRHRPVAETWCSRVAELNHGNEMREAIVTPEGVAATSASVYVRIDVRQHWWRHDTSVVSGRRWRDYGVVQTAAGWRVDEEGRD